MLVTPSEMCHQCKFAYVFIRVFEDEIVRIEQKKPFSFLLTEAYLKSDTESLTAVSKLAKTRSVICSLQYTGI